MTKNPFLTVGILLLTLVAGAGAVYVLFPASSPDRAEETTAPQPALQEALPPQPAAPLSESISTVNMEKSSLVEGITETDPQETKMEDGSALPSQLSKIKVEGMVGIAPSEEEEDAPVEEPKSTGVNVQNIQDLASVIPLTAVEGASQEEASSTPAENEPTSITMLSVPAKVRLIKSTEEYKEFKKIARGKYPQVDFNKQMVVVLESENNLPDKVFEIQDVQTKDGKLLITYRVNIFDLDSKLNTHTAKAVAKSSLPVELKQVL